MDQRSLLKAIFVVGGGTMGCGIAQVVAAAGMAVVLRDIRAELTAVAQRKIETSLTKAASKGHITDGAMRATIGRIQTTEDLAGAADADLVIEAIPENLGLKKTLFCALDSICSSTTVFATNTSALSVSAIAAATRHPNRVLGIHFFNPVPAMRLVELIQGDETSQETLMRARKFITCIGKIPIDAKDTPGFVVNRLLVPMINEAICAYGDGIASAENIDRAMQLGAGHPMGPLALADRIGLDVILKVMETLEEAFEDPKYHPSTLLRQMVAEGKLGRKSKQGFHSYTSPKLTK